MENRRQVDYFVDSLKTIAAIFALSPLNLEALNLVVNSAQAEERSIEPLEMLPGDKEQIALSINYLRMLTEKNPETFMPIRLWFSRVIMRLCV